VGGLWYIFTTVSPEDRRSVFPAPGPLAGISFKTGNFRIDSGPISQINHLSTIAHLLGLGGSSSKVVVEVKGYEPLEEDNGDDGSEFSYSLDEDISVSKRPKRLRSACFKCGTVFGITIT